MCIECDRQPDLRHDHSVSATHLVTYAHDCAPGIAELAIDGVTPVVQQATSDCCGAVLAEGGTVEAGFSCTACGKPCQRVLSARMAHWTCQCGVIRHQELQPKPDALSLPAGGS